MKTIVYLNGEKHSAWYSKAEAIKQMEVLGNNGYSNFHYDFIDHNYENGHYFI